MDAAIASGLSLSEEWRRMAGRVGELPYLETWPIAAVTVGVRSVRFGV